MYEHLRNDFTMRLAMKYSRDQVLEIASMLDHVANNYDISEKTTALAVIEDPIPKAVKNYIASKRLEGLAETSLKNYFGHLRLFFEQMQKQPEDITTNDIRMYLATYKAQRGVTDRSLDKMRQVLNAFFTWLTDEEYILKNPCRTIKSIKWVAKPRQSLTRLQLERLRRMCKSKRELAILDVFFSTGCRVSELANMKLSDINMGTRCVNIIGKGSKPNVVYLNDNAQLSITDYLTERKGDSEYLFVRERSPYDKLSTRSIEHILKQYEKALGCPVYPHIIRHTTATLSLKAGMPITQVQKLLNHASVSTTQIYAETLQDDVRASHERYVI